ncbi:MAG: hypothetical protein R3F12_08265 [Lysobacteraceae bacterium]|nr:hypothetical protein [Xanthomonadaceae bacterium]HRY00818.1 hypothetical protein [Xanthomonadaceae bacterium]
MKCWKELSLMAALLVGTVVATPAAAEGAQLDCRLDYDLRGWSLVYKHATGEGTVSCENGQRMRVQISAKAIGVTAGKWHIDNGRGHFSDIHDIRDVLGNYVQATANAGVGKSSEAQVLTKGTVSLALAGDGEGVNLGVDVGKFTLDAIE